MDENELLLNELPADVDPEIREQFLAMFREVDEAFRALDWEVDEIFLAMDRELDAEFAELDEIDRDLEELDREIDEELAEVDDVDKELEAFDREIEQELAAIDAEINDISDLASEENEREGPNERERQQPIHAPVPNQPNAGDNLTAVCTNFSISDISNPTSLAVLCYFGYLHLPGFPSKKTRRMRDLVSHPFRKAHQPFRKPRLRVGVDLFSDLVRRREHLSVFTNFDLPEFNELLRILEFQVSQPRDPYALYTEEHNAVRVGRKRKLPLEQRLFMTLRWLKFGTSSIASLSVECGVSYETLRCEFFHIISAIVKSPQMRSLVQWPDVQERARLSITCPCFPGVIGFLDGSNFEIQRPANDNLQAWYYSGEKKFHSLKCLAVVDHCGYFRWIETGCEGIVHDRQMFNGSELCRERHRFFSPGECVGADKGFVGDGPVMTAFKLNNLVGNPVHQYFNALFNKERIIVEWSFGALKTKWAILQHSFTLGRDSFASVMLACVYLTNFWFCKYSSLRPQYLL